MASFADDAPAESRLGRRRARPEIHVAIRRLVAPRYLASIGLAVPLVVVALAQLGAGGRFAVAAYLIVVLCVLSAIDVTERRLPNRIVLPSAAVVLVAQAALSPDRVFEWVVAGVGASLVLLLPLLVYPSSVGMGDAKLALLVGAALGSAVVTALVLASLAAAAYAVGLFLRHGAAARRSTVPFGPFIAFGAVVALLI